MHHLPPPTSQMLRSKFFSDILKDSISYQTYLPAEYIKFDSLSILYLLHGHSGNDSTWTKPNQGNIQEVLDSLINKHLIPPVIAVTLDAANTWYVDSHQKMESAYIKEFIPLIESKFRENTIGNHRIIAGNSAGGYGALRFALKYPDLFQSAILLSPAAYYPEPPPNSSSRKINVFSADSLFDAEVWKSYAHPSLLDDYKNVDNPPKFYISTGDDDEYGIVNVVTDLRSLFLENDIKHELSIIDGIHDWKVWSNRFSHDIIRAFDDKKLPKKALP